MNAILRYHLNSKTINNKYLLYQTLNYLSTTHNFNTTANNNNKNCCTINKEKIQELGQPTYWT